MGRISFFVNAGMRFVTELCKMRSFVELWDEITLGRYGIADEAMRRFRYGVRKRRKRVQSCFIAGIS